MYNVMIVEDDPMARRLLEIMVTSDESYHLAVSVESASVAEVYCMTEAIDLILMDVCTALHASGLDAAIKIKKLFPQIRIIIITKIGRNTILFRHLSLLLCLLRNKIAKNSVTSARIQPMTQ